MKLEIAIWLQKLIKPELASASENLNPVSEKLAAQILRVSIDTVSLCILNRAVSTKSSTLNDYQVCFLFVQCHFSKVISSHYLHMKSWPKV